MQPHDTDRDTDTIARLILAGHSMRQALPLARRTKTLVGSTGQGAGPILCVTSPCGLYPWTGRGTLTVPPGSNECSRPGRPLKSRSSLEDESVGCPLLVTSANCGVNASLLEHLPSSWGQQPAAFWGYASNACRVRNRRCGRGRTARSAGQRSGRWSLSRSSVTYCSGAGAGTVERGYHFFTLPLRSGSDSSFY